MFPLVRFESDRQNWNRIAQQNASRIQSLEAEIASQRAAHTQRLARMKETIGHTITRMFADGS